MLAGLKLAMKVAKTTSEEFAGTSGEAHACMLIQERLEVYLHEEMQAMALALEKQYVCPKCKTRHTRSALDNNVRRKPHTVAGLFRLHYVCSHCDNDVALEASATWKKED